MHTVARIIRSYAGRDLVIFVRIVLAPCPVLAGCRMLYADIVKGIKIGAM